MYCDGCTMADEITCPKCRYSKVMETTMITEDYVSFETAKLLREKGFDVETYASIKVFAGRNYEVNGEWITPTKDTIIPTLQVAMRWLREVHKLYVVVRPYVTEEGIFNLFDIKDINDTNIVVNIRSKTGFNSYEEACEAAIKYCLENLI